MLDFTLPLALYDFLPVIFTGLAMWALAGFAGRIDPARYAMMLTGGGLVLAGGLAKALWKLIAALTGQDIGWLATLLFPLMAPGFLVVAVALSGAVSRLRGGAMALGWPLVWVLLGILAGAVGVREWLLDIPRGWFLPLLVCASIGNLVATVQLVRASLHLRRAWIVVLLVINLGMVVVLPPIAMAGPSTLWMHWIEQTLTAVGSGCFAAAAFWLRGLLPLSPGAESAGDWAASLSGDG